MDKADRLNFLIDNLRSEKDTSPEKVAERLELLKVAEMLETMVEMHTHEDTEEEAEKRFQNTGIGRDYGRERRDIIKFMNLLIERLDQYYSGRQCGR